MSGGIARQRLLGLLAVAMAATAIGCVADATGVLALIERNSVDVRFALRPHRHPPSDVVVVGLDQSSLSVLPQYPFSRTLHARVIEHLHAAGARVIVYDIAFDRPQKGAGGESADLALFEAAGRAAPVIFATARIRSGETQVLGGNANLASIGSQAAAAQVAEDPDGVVRHTLGEVNRLPTIAAAVGRTVTGREPSQKQLRSGWIDFPGPPGTVRDLSFVNVLHDRFDPALVRGKVVVVGATAPELHDLHATAAGRLMSGPEIQADAISTVLGGFPLRSPAGIVTVLVIVALGCAVPIAGLRLGPVGTCLSALGLFGAWSLATQLAFDAGAVLDYSDPVASLAFGTVGTVVLGMWTEAREHSHLRAMFAADAGDVVDRVLSGPRGFALAATAIIAGYRIDRVLGRGGMGVVYSATQLALGRPVAIKLIAAERAEDPVFRERFTSESRIAASIEHPNVIPVFEAGEDGGLLFIAMRLVDGVDLGQLLARLGPLAPERATAVITQLAGALDAAHARGLVHRDVKPANVLLTVDEREHAYLTDFGVAVEAGTAGRITRVGQWVGTLDYLAPEQIRGEPVDARADIYALTGLLYHCLTGTAPFTGSHDAALMWAHVSAPVPKPTDALEHLPSGLDQVVAIGMAKDPQARFSSATALAHACARSVGMPVIERPAPPSAASNSGRHSPASDSAPTTVPD